MNKQAAIYARVSTDDQAEHGYSLPSQIEACQKFAWQKGFDVITVYQDDISGAKSIASRPAGELLQSAIDEREVNIVIVYQVDRLSRDIVDLLATVRDWLRAGVEVYTLDMGQVTSELDIVLVIKGWQGGDERQKIRERTMRGRSAKAKAGKVVGQGVAPYGYRYTNGALVIDENQARIVRIIFELYTKGDGNGRVMSLQLIADKLTSMAIPRPAESMGWQKRRGARPMWEPVSILRIVRNETYCGVWRYGKNVGLRGVGGRRPIDEQIPVNVPAIVTRDIWDLAQAQRAYNSRVARRKMKREYLLRGLIFCGCGRRMVGTDGKYYCPRRYQPRGGPTCSERLVDGKIIEPITWDYLMKLIKNPLEFEEKLRQAQSKEAATMQPKQKELEHVLALLKDTENEAEVIARETLKAQGIIAAKLEQQGDEVNRRYQALITRKIELQDTLALELTDHTINNLLQFREVVAVGLENPTHEDRRRWLEILQTTVSVTDSIAVITCRLGGNVRYNLHENELHKS